MVFVITGMAIAARIMLIATTITSSRRVKPREKRARERGRVLCGFAEPQIILSP
jgi:hypothetical protein